MFEYYQELLGKHSAPTVRVPVPHDRTVVGAVVGFVGRMKILHMNQSKEDREASPMRDARRGSYQVPYRSTQHGKYEIRIAGGCNAAVAEEIFKKAMTDAGITPERIGHCHISANKRETAKESADNNFLLGSRKCKSKNDVEWTTCSSHCLETSPSQRWKRIQQYG